MSSALLSGVPMTPIKATAHNVTMNGVQLSWIMPPGHRGSGLSLSSGEAGGTIYKVEARLETSDLWKHVQGRVACFGQLPSRTIAYTYSFLVIHPSDAISSNAYLITGHLIPNCRYQFRVFAQNRLGRSAPSVPTHFVQTLPGAPAKAVRNLRATVMVSGEILVQWQPLQKVEWGSENVGYFVEWQFVNLTSEVVKSSVTLRTSHIDHYVIPAGDVKFCSRHEVCGGCAVGMTFAPTDN